MNKEKLSEWIYTGLSVVMMAVMFAFIAYAFALGG